jgi:hypothetical protein
MEPGTATITGTVSRRRIAAGSKSDRIGVVLQDETGQTYALRRAGGNPFSDAALDKLVGKTITGTGVVSGRSFIMNRWEVNSAEPSR